MCTVPSRLDGTTGRLYSCHQHSLQQPIDKITINVPVVYMVRYVVVLTTKAILGVGGLKIETFLGPEMATSY
jgi:hypothetical protein